MAGMGGIEVDVSNEDGDKLSVKQAANGKDVEFRFKSAAGGPEVKFTIPPEHLAKIAMLYG